MIKQSIYPKTIRLGADKIQITEKLDGSNLGIGIYNEKLYIFTRNSIYLEDELLENKDKLYKNLYDFIEKNKELIKNSLNDNTLIIGEWLGMGVIKYNSFKSNFLLFAKAKIEMVDNKFKIFSLDYTIENLKYAFKEQSIINIFETVPLLEYNLDYVSKEILDNLYEEYSKKQNRNVEGFVIFEKNCVRKYVRFKKGKMTEHLVKV